MKLVLFIFGICLFSSVSASQFTIGASADSTVQTIDFFAVDDQTETSELLFIASQSNDLLVSHDETPVLMYENAADTFHFFTTLYVRSEEPGNTNTISADEITINNYSQWTLVYKSNFAENTEGWSSSAISTCGDSGKTLLGGYCNFANDEVSKTFTDLPSHSEIKISFNIDLIDSWDNKYVAAKVDSQIFWTKNRDWCPGILEWYCTNTGLNVCGRYIPDQVGTYVEFVTIHDLSELTFSVFSNLDLDPCDASWGIYNVELYVR